MKTWLRYFVWTIEASIVIAVVYFEPTHAVRGIVHREAFFNGRPTSYWRNVVEGDLRLDPASFLLSPQYVPPTFWQRCTGLGKFSSRLDSSHKLLDNEQARAVLHELGQDSSPQIAAFAQDGLDLERKLPSVRHMNSNFDALPRDSQVNLFWMNQIDVHNMQQRRKIGN
jgi:hypothetical protein